METRSELGLALRLDPTLMRPCRHLDELIGRLITHSLEPVFLSRVDYGYNKLTCDELVLSPHHWFFVVDNAVDEVTYALDRKAKGSSIRVVAICCVWIHISLCELLNRFVVGDVNVDCSLAPN